MFIQQNGYLSQFSYSYYKNLLVVAGDVKVFNVRVIIFVDARVHLLLRGLEPLANGAKRPLDQDVLDHGRGLCLLLFPVSQLPLGATALIPPTPLIPIPALFRHSGGLKKITKNISADRTYLGRICQNISI